jgi:SAM-dependent methyltransferase
MLKNVKVLKSFSFDRKKIEECYCHYKDAIVSQIKNNEIGKLEMGEFFSLLWLNCKVTVRSFIEYIRVVYRYYGNKKFLKADLSIRLMYLFNNPYKISKRFLKSRNSEDVYTYGETPLTTLEVIAKECQINENDTVYELGCGRGLVCFWLNAIKGCKVVGVEYNPAFVQRADRVVARLKLDGVKFINTDICDVNLHGATVCYLYGTCLDDKTIKKMISKFSRLPAGTRIVTVSFPLSDYTNEDWFELMHTFSVPFTWGNADVYIQIKK